jgi:hypothetical protein
VGQAPAGQDLQAIVALVQKVMLGAMAGDQATLEAHLAPGAEIVFTGGRRFASPAEIGAFNATRYAWVRKAIDRWDVTFDGEEVLVYSLGTLYGEWPDGTPFQGNRYIDRFVLVGGRITRMDVWNDSAELLLGR